MVQKFQVIQYMNSINNFKEVILRGEEHEDLEYAINELETIINDIKRNSNWKIINHESTTYNCKYFDSILNKDIMIDYYIKTL